MTKLIFTILTVFLSHFCFSQISIGAATGLSIAQGSFKLSSDYTKMPLLGLPFSLITEIQLNKSLRLSTGLSFIKKGIRVTSTTSGVDYDESLIFNYMEIPATLKVYVTKGPFKIFGIGGPYLGIITSIRDKYTQTSGTSVTKGNDRFKPSDLGIETFDFGLRLGAGFEYTKSFGSIIVSPCYHIGFTNFSSSKQEVGRNNALLLNLGYLYTIPKKAKKSESK